MNLDIFPDETLEMLHEALGHAYEEADDRAAKSPEWKEWRDALEELMEKRDLDFEHIVLAGEPQEDDEDDGEEREDEDGRRKKSPRPRVAKKVMMTKREMKTTTRNRRPKVEARMRTKTRTTRKTTKSQRPKAEARMRTKKTTKSQKRSASSHGRLSRASERGDWVSTPAACCCPATGISAGPVVS